MRWCVRGVGVQGFLAQGSRRDFAYLAFRLGGLSGRVVHSQQHLQHK